MKLELKLKNWLNDLIRSARANYFDNMVTVVDRIFTSLDNVRIKKLINKKISDVWNMSVLK